LQSAQKIRSLRKRGTDVEVISSGDEEEKNEQGEIRKQKTPQVRSKKANGLANPLRGYESENEKSIDSATTSSTLIPIRLQSKAGQSVAAGE
jgi:hypothetical protein